VGVSNYMAISASRDAEQAAKTSSEVDRRLIVENRERIDSLEAARIERLRVINRLALRECTEIEQLKKQNRDAAIQDYNRLDETLELLNIPRTVRVEARARSDRDDVLRVNAPKKCPREVIK
jgi:hypothetical protein